MNSSTPASRNEKAIRLVEYLLRLASLRTKLIRDIEYYKENGNILWLSNIPHERGCFTQAWGRDEEHEPDEWLEVQKQPEPELPTVPAQFKDWVNLPSLRNKGDLPELFPEITRQIPNPDWREKSDQPETVPYTERLEDHPEVQRAWNRYVEDKWLPWTEEHNRWEKVHKVYSALFAIHQEQLRLGEEYELVLGLGLLTWQTPSGQRVRRHLVVADAILEFEARLGKFTVHSHTEGSKLRPELDMLDIEEQPARAEETAKVSLASAEDDPWEKDCIESVLKALVHSINSQGHYDDSLEGKSIRASAKPIVEYAPALILRKRSAKGLTETLRRIKEQIENGEDIPGEFADLAEIRRKDDREPPDGPQETNAAFDGEIFFPKPSNEEQRRIVDKIRAASGVLVQGPPGTGKSHTIANLICHLLATGNRILVTAKTPRALQVLEGLIPPELRPLCVNLVGSGYKERQFMESSVKGILRKIGEWKEEHVRRERAELEKRLREIREEKSKVIRWLRDIRESETHTQSIAEGSYSGTAARIAESVNRDRNAYAWFKDVAHFYDSCPTTTSELCSAVATLRGLTPDKRQELKLEWPPNLPSIDDISKLFDKESHAKVEETQIGKGADEQVAGILLPFDGGAIASLAQCLSGIQRERARILGFSYGWVPGFLRDAVENRLSRWLERSSMTYKAINSIGLRDTVHIIACPACGRDNRVRPHSIREIPVCGSCHARIIDDDRLQLDGMKATTPPNLELMNFVADVDKVNLELPNEINSESLQADAEILKEHFEQGGKIGWRWFRPRVVKNREYVLNIRVNGQRCTSPEHLSLLLDVLTVQKALQSAWDVWVTCDTRVTGSYSLQLQELLNRCMVLDDALKFVALIEKARQEIVKFPQLTEPIWDDHSRVAEFVASCNLALARQSRLAAQAEIRQFERDLSLFCAQNDAHPIVSEALESIKMRDIIGFARFWKRMQELDEQRTRINKLDEYLSKLHSTLPKFTDELCKTSGESYWDDRTAQFTNAWHWAQAQYWIDNYLREGDATSLSKRAKQIEDEIDYCLCELASSYAWGFCFKRMERRHRRHLEAWQQEMRRFGKGTGKHAAHHRREAQQHLNKCREAVPAWVMPLHRVWDTVDPVPGMFDVIIVDEASQCGVEALPLFYLGKKILIVGDDKQISPDAVGVPRDAVFYLMREFLHDFEYQSSFDVESSLFGHGRLRYGTRLINLREHFRCMPEIIRFSNDLCYSDTPLIPLRQYGRNRLRPINHIFVEGGYREGSGNRTINRPEADAIVKKIVELCGDRRYDGKTMGVVVLQGDAQAALIEGQLLERLGAEEMERRRLICGNPYSFQGDERHIVFLSLVAASNERIGPFTKAADERRFNVAASRGQDQIWLFHSVRREDLSTTDLRRKLLEFFEDTKPSQLAGIDIIELERKAEQENRTIVKPPGPFDSWFEVDVALELLRKGFAVNPQFEVAGKRIDLVVEGGQTRLAVECDGDHWHGADRYEADMQRQRQLERCGWEFFRVRESAFYLNKEEAFRGLWRMLEERSIYPHKGEEDTAEETSEPNDAEPESIELLRTGDDIVPIQSNGTPDESIKVRIGSTVVYVDEDDGRECQALITSGSSNPDWGTINANTPIAKALLGATVGQVVVAHRPLGPVRLRVIKVS
jgi:transcription elongation GreA/GreB family factor